MEQSRGKGLQMQECGGDPGGWSRAWALERGHGWGQQGARKSLLDGGSLDICHPKMFGAPEALDAWDSSQAPAPPWHLVLTGAQDLCFPTLCRVQCYTELPLCSERSVPAARKTSPSLAELLAGEVASQTHECRECLERGVRGCWTRAGGGHFAGDCSLE